MRHVSSETVVNTYVEEKLKNGVVAVECKQL
jgi:hypothetical protein